MLMKKKLVAVGIIAGCAFGAAAAGIAWATPGSGISTTIISGRSFPPARL